MSIIVRWRHELFAWMKAFRLLMRPASSRAALLSGLILPQIPCGLVEEHIFVLCPLRSDLFVAAVALDLRENTERPPP